LVRAPQYEFVQIYTCPILPGNLREIPPLDTPAATPPLLSKQIAPTVSNAASWNS